MRIALFCIVLGLMVTEAGANERTLTAEPMEEKMLPEGIKEDQQATTYEFSRKVMGWLIRQNVFKQLIQKMNTDNACNDEQRMQQIEALEKYSVAAKPLLVYANEYYTNGILLVSDEKYTQIPATAVKLYVAHEANKSVNIQSKKDSSVLCAELQKTLNWFSEHSKVEIEHTQFPPSK